MTLLYESQQHTVPVCRSLLVESTDEGRSSPLEGRAPVGGRRPLELTLVRDRRLPEPTHSRSCKT